MIDLVRYDSMFSQDVLGPSDAKGQLDRWTIDLAKGTVHMERKDDRHLEFPRINETFTGKKHRYGYLPDVENFFGSGEAAGASIVKYDYETGSTLSSRLDPAIVLGEMSFVPNPTCAAEDDGVLIGFAVDRRSDEGSCCCSMRPAWISWPPSICRSEFRQASTATGLRAEIVIGPGDTSGTGLSVNRRGNSSAAVTLVAWRSRRPSAPYSGRSGFQVPPG